MSVLKKCAACGKYTLQESCSCGGEATDHAPPKFSFPDTYGKYRRKQKLKSSTHKEAVP